MNTDPWVVGYCTCKTGADPEGRSPDCGVHREPVVNRLRPPVVAVDVEAMTTVSALQ